MTELTGRLLVTGESVAQRFLDQLSDAGLEVVNPPESFPPAVMSEQTLQAALTSCVACLLGGDEIVTESVLESAGELRAIAFLGVGYESYVDADAARRRGVAVTNTPGVLSNSVAEFTVGLLLDARRRITDYVTCGEEIPHETRFDLAGHAVGVVGLGAIGTRICEILALGLQADVRYFSRTRKRSVEERLGIAYSPLGELVRDVECLIVMVPETAETTGMIGRELLAARPESSRLTLINTSRAGVVDPLGLEWGIDCELVETAWFDGFYREDSELTRRLAARPEVRITPHIASLTHDARDAMSAMAVESLLNLLRDGQDDYVVNR
jgi:phosphoglycerate dehydrogenase-like enzyme